MAQTQDRKTLVFVISLFTLFLLLFFRLGKIVDIDLNVYLKYTVALGSILFFLVEILLFFKFKKTVLASIFLLIRFLVVLTSWGFSGTMGEIDLIWVYIFPLLVYFLLGTKKGNYIMFPSFILGAIYLIIDVSPLGPINKIVPGLPTVSFYFIFSLLLYSGVRELERNTKLVSLQAEELKKFQLAVEGASDHIIITNAEGIILFANESVQRITGYSVKEVMGKKAGTTKLWGGLMDQKFYEGLWKTIKKDKKPFKGNVKNRRKNGEEYIAELTISPVIDEKKKVKYFVGVERDVTKEKEVDRMKSEFVSIASHQMKSPLSTTKWAVELFLDGDLGKLTKKQGEVLSDINNATNRLIDLVNNLLNISRIESGRIMIKPENIDIEKVIKEIRKDLEIEIEKKKQHFVTKIDPSLGKIWTDSNLLENIYSNLLKNAVKYTPEKGTIKLQIKKKKETYLTTISDTGYGIPVADHDRIFSKFFRAQNIVSKHPDGNGLGLYIVKQIVEAMHGTISFTSKENEGTSFFVELPLAGLKAKKGEVKLS